jgi:hypothetical protein
MSEDDQQGDSHDDEENLVDYESAQEEDGPPEHSPVGPTTPPNHPSDRIILGLSFIANREK